MWLEDFIVVMVKTRAQKKMNNTTNIKEEPTTRMENQSIGFHKLSKLSNASHLMRW